MPRLILSWPQAGKMSVTISAALVPGIPDTTAVISPYGPEQPVAFNYDLPSVAMPRFKQGMRIHCSRWRS